MDENTKNNLGTFGLCRTWALGSKIWKKMKNKNGGADWTPSTFLTPTSPEAREPQFMLEPRRFGREVELLTMVAGARFFPSPPLLVFFSLFFSFSFFSSSSFLLILPRVQLRVAVAPPFSLLFAASYCSLNKRGNDGGELLSSTFFCSHATAATTPPTIRSTKGTRCPCFSLQLVSMAKQPRAQTPNDGGGGSCCHHHECTCKVPTDKAKRRQRERGKMKMKNNKRGRGGF